MSENTYLLAQYADRERVKALGGRWDPSERRWYVPAGMDLASFAAWLPKSVPNSDSRALKVATLESSRPVSMVVSRRTISLSQLLAGVAQAVAQGYPAGLWTMVEVVDARLRNGHVFLEVAERTPGGDLAAKANAVLWAKAANSLLPDFERITGAKISPGIKLLLRLRPVFKPQYGFSLEVDAIDPEYTLGDLEAKKREIRTRLQREGLFDGNRQLPPPWDFFAVMVVAPAGAAGLGDFQVEADRYAAGGICRFAYVTSRFQGEGAAAEVRVSFLDGLTNWFQREGAYPDAVVIIRGGGAVNDLAWLNDYDLARAVCEAPVPVFTGIGHERDSTVLDEVAQQKFDTPSKVIQGISQRIHRRTLEVASYFNEVARTSTAAVREGRTAIDAAEALVKASAQRQVATASRLTDTSMTSVRFNSLTTIRAAAETTEEANSAVQTIARRRVSDAKLMLPGLLATLRLEANAAVRAARLNSQSAFRVLAERGSLSVARVRESSAADMANVASEARRDVRNIKASAEALMREIAGQGPERTLARGFSIVRDTDGQTVTSKAQVRQGQLLNIQFQDGTVPVQNQLSGD
jgi:exodeoxyribonuclease VII large subunit